MKKIPERLRTILQGIEPDNPFLTFKLEASLGPPENEEIVIHSTAQKSLDNFIKREGLDKNPSLKSLTITGPNGIIKQWPER